MRWTASRLWVVPFAALAAAAAPSAALDINGFMPGAGRGALAFTATVEGYDEFWVGDTKVSDPGVGEVETNSLTAWFTWGLTDNFALVVNLPYVDTTSDGLGGFEDNGLQDLTALAKLRFASFGNGGTRHSLVGAAGVRTPASDYEGNLPVDLGDATTDALLRLVYQLESGSFYFSQQVGFDVRGDDAPDGIPLYTELGWSAGPATWTLFYAQLIADGGTDIGDPGFTFPSNGDEYQRVGAKVYGRFTEALGGTLGGFTTLDGRNSGDVTGFFGGLVVSF
ncbi:MAG TPA: hypothetical protein VF121_02935 [Thermoanaerobaculia bacterium]|nr:hypothetical protein [Thermoanaerobaculia bacterium]